MKNNIISSFLLLSLIFLLSSCTKFEKPPIIIPEDVEDPSGGGGDPNLDYSVLPLEAKEVDNSSLLGKTLFGYQGWFAVPSDPINRFWHWGDNLNSSSGVIGVEMFPDMRELCRDEKYGTAFTYPDGSPAYLFSSQNERTIMRHMKWLRDYHLDGVFVQRFLNEKGDGVVWEMRNKTTKNVQKGCEKYGRVFAVMYDGISGADQIIEDWKLVVDQQRFTSSGRYLMHDGLPVVAIYGYQIYNFSTDDLAKTMEFFTNSTETKYRASVILTLHGDWFNLNDAWKTSLRRAKAIFQWGVGGYTDQSNFNDYFNNQMTPGRTWCENNGVTYMPLLFPGFSWYNRYNGEKPFNQIKRNGGDFLWVQAYSALKNNARTLYFAMFDEVDEATSFFKTAEDASMSPSKGLWLNFDADGYQLPSDWYLRCASKAALALKGLITNYEPSLGTPPLGGVTLYPIDDDNAEKKGIKLLFPDFQNEEMIEFSVDGGRSWPYTTYDNVGTLFIELNAGTYEVCARHAEGRTVVPMGEVKLF